jgi:hypothetical protein
MPRAWLELPRDAGWGDVRVALGRMAALEYLTDELRGSGPVLLRLSAVRLEGGEALRVPGER